MSGRSPKKDLSDDQKIAILAYARKHGGTWKRELRIDWERACEGIVPGKYQAELQQIRNEFGPSWLNKFRLNKAVDKWLTEECALRVWKQEASAAAVELVALDILCDDDPYELNEGMGHAFKAGQSPRAFIEQAFADDIASAKHDATQMAEAFEGHEGIHEEDEDFDDSSIPEAR